MFDHIKGVLTQVTTSFAVVEASGVGYKILVPVHLSPKLPSQGNIVTLYTSFVVREQAQMLYGFLTIQERDFFETLMGVTGVGPKLALALIGHMPVGELQRAIAEEDVAAICRVPGIGKKGAERLIMEMRDKVQGFAFGPEELTVHHHEDPRAQTVSDVMSALINLGYNHTTAQKAVKKTLQDLPESIDVAQMISTALKHV